MNIIRTPALFLSLGACAAGVQDPPAVRQAWSHAVLMADCAPWDGAATSIVLTESPLMRATDPRPLLRLSIYTGTGAVGGHRWTLGESRDGGGQAAWCPMTGTCTSATSGWVALGSVNDSQTVKGKYHVRFIDGHTLEGKFAATLDPRRVICG